MGRVASTGEEIVITKHGKPIAKLVAARRARNAPRSVHGCVRGTMLVSAAIETKNVRVMGPIRAERLSSDQRMARLVEEGMVSPPKGKGLRSVRPVKVRGRSVAATLLEDRG